MKQIRNSKKYLKRTKFCLMVSVAMFYIRGITAISVSVDRDVANLGADLFRGNWFQMSRVFNISLLLGMKMVNFRHVVSDWYRSIGIWTEIAGRE
jgi:uncharacterized metal-binding protein